MTTKLVTEARRVEALVTKRTRRTRERLQIAGIDVLLPIGMTAAEVLTLVDMIYSRPLSSPAIHEGRPAGVSSPPGRAAAEEPAGPVGDVKPRSTAGQRAVKRVERQRRRAPIVARGG